MKKILVVDDEFDILTTWRLVLEMEGYEVVTASNGRMFRELADAGLAVNAWLVPLHNTRLGQAYPDITVENAFGDRYVYSLCPSSPDAREYAIALCKDVTDNYPVLGMCAARALAGSPTRSRPSETSRGVRRQGCRNHRRVGRHRS